MPPWRMSLIRRVSTLSALCCQWGVRYLVVPQTGMRTLSHGCLRCSRKHAVQARGLLLFRCTLKLTARTTEKHKPLRWQFTPRAVTWGGLRCNYGDESSVGGSGKRAICVCAAHPAAHSGAGCEGHAAQRTHRASPLHPPQGMRAQPPMIKTSTPQLNTILGLRVKSFGPLEARAPNWVLWACREIFGQAQDGA